MSTENISNDNISRPERQGQGSRINFEWANPYYIADQERYNQIYQNVGADLSNPDGLRKKKEKGVTRKDQLAMNQLCNIVGSNAKKDIKRMNELVTVNNANKWIRNRNLQQYYSVSEEDVDRDGVKEVVVKDKEGNLVVVNGYTIKDSDLPYRQMFYDIPENERKEMRADYKEEGKPFGYKQWARDFYYKPVYDGEGITIQDFTGHDPKTDEFTKKIKNSGYKLIVPRSHTPYQAFSIRFVKPMYDYTIHRFRLFTANGGKPNIYIKVLSAAWNHIILMPALTAIFRSPEKAEQVLSREPQTLEKIKKTSQFKTYVKNIMRDFLNRSDQTNDNFKGIIYNITLFFAERWFTEHPEVEKIEGFGMENVAVDVPVLTHLSPPPSPERN